MRQRSVIARSGIVAAAIGMLAITSLAGMGAAAPSAAAAARVSAAASLSSVTPPTQGHTTCVPWPKPTSPGLKCTGTYSGNTAWNPWTWQSISQQPVVTVSQTKDLTDQGVQVNWSNFTPTLNGNSIAPNSSSTAARYSVSIFECEGTNPDASNGFGLTGPPLQCYTPQIGSSTQAANAGPPNAVVESTFDTSSPPAHPATPPGCHQNANYPLSSPFAFWTATNVCKSSWDGGNPATWTGQADFHVEAPTPKTKGGFFNCASSTPCSLVIVPNFGGTPVLDKTGNFSWTDTSRCSQHYIGAGFDPKKANPSLLGEPGDPYGPQGSGDLQAFNPSQPFAGPYGPYTSTSMASVQGASAACWAADRIVIPLSFAPKSSDCPNQTPAFYAVGSPMMQTQMLQWQAGWCTGRAPVTLNTTFNSESVARLDFLTSGSQAGGAGTDMALVTLPVTAAEQGASHRQFTYAPLANSGAGIGYALDDNQTGAQIQQMVLDPQLLAKLVTESYTLFYGCTSTAHTKPSLTCDPAVWGSGKNPYSLYQDPEFLALNKNCLPYGQPANYACGSTDWPPQAASSSYGTYQGAFLPTVLVSDNDMTYDLSGWIAANPNASAFLNGSADSWGQRVNTNYQHISFPAQTFSVLDQGYTQLPTCATPQQGGCQNVDHGTVQDATMQAAWNPQQDLDTIVGRLLTDQPTAFLPDASCPVVTCNFANQLVPTSGMTPQYVGQRDLLSELDLGDIASYQIPAAKLVNAAGNAVAPSQASVEAAVSGMKTNPDGITQYVDYAKTTGNDYPLAMTDYAMVPTCGVSHTEAAAIADFLTKAATTGQTQGEAPGQLGPGYYPLTAKQKAQTLKAALAVKDQTCKSPPPDHNVGGHHSGPGTNPTGSSPSKGKSPGGTGPSAGPSPLHNAKTAAFGQKSGDSGLAGLLLLLAVVTGALLVLGGPAAWVITVTGRWPMVLGKVRAARAWLQAGLGRLAGLVIRRA